MLTMIVSACSSKSSSDGKSDSKGSNDVISVAIDEASWTKDLEAFGKAVKGHTNLDFKVTTYPDTTTYQSTLRSALSTSEAPGMFKWWSGYRMEDLVKGGLVADLTEEWKKFEDLGLNPDLASAFTFDGKIYGIPMTSNYWVIFYNKKLYDQFNLKVPKTWEDFISNCETLKENGISPLAQNTEGRWPGFIWFEELLTKYDPDLYQDLMTGKASYTDSGVVEVMEIWKSLYDKGYFSKPLDWESNMATEFANGKVAMFAKGDWYQNFLTGAGMTTDDYGMFILPSIKPEAGKTVIFEASPLLIAEKSKDKDNALKATEAFFEKDVIGPWTTSKSIAPLVPGVDMPNPEVGTLIDTITNDQYKLINRYWEATPPDISEFAVDQFVRFMLKPDEYKKVLEEIDKHAKDYWKSRK